MRLAACLDMQDEAPRAVEEWTLALSGNGEVIKSRTRPSIKCLFTFHGKTGLGIGHYM